MSIDYLSILIAALVSISLAAERLVTIIKTLLPVLAQEAKPPKSDRWRSFLVQLIAFGAAWVTAAFLAKDGFDMFGMIEFGETPRLMSIHVWVIGFMATGGSTFWKNVLEYTKAVKEIRKSEVPK